MVELNHVNPQQAVRHIYIALETVDMVCTNAVIYPYFSNSLTKYTVSCSGENSCITNPELVSRNNNLYCSGKQGCTSAGIKKGERVQCSGQYACRYGTIQAKRTLSCGGVSTCYGARQRAYRIMCGGYFGCSSSQRVYAGKYLI